MIETSRSDKTPALFLDRDGVINVDHGYVHRIDQIEFLAGIFELGRVASLELGWPIVIVSNQSGIGRGLFDEAAYRTLTDWLCERFKAEQAPIARAYHCPFHPEHGVGEYRREHEWRKPRPGMILQAAADLRLDLAGSILIGDRASDMEAAAAAGVGLRILLDHGRAAPPGAHHHVVETLAAATPLLRRVGKSGA